MKEEISLKNILDIIKSRIVIILSVTVLVTLAAAGATKFYISPKYTSTIKLCVVSDLENSSSSAANDRNTILYAKDLVETCVETLNSGDAYSNLKNKLVEMNAAYDNTNVGASNINVSQIGNSNVLRIDVTTSSSQLSYDSCIAFESMAKERVPMIGQVTVEKLDSATRAANPSSPSMMKNCILGALIGFVLCAAVVIFIAMMDNTVKDGSELARQLDILLLAEIPDINNASDREKYYEYKQKTTGKGNGYYGR